MAKLVFLDGSHEELEDGSSIGDAAEKHGVFRACSQGFCGTCIVSILEGGENLSPPTQQEIDFLGQDGVKKERMTCQAKIMKGTVKVGI